MKKSILLLITIASVLHKGQVYWADKAFKKEPPKPEPFSFKNDIDDENVNLSTGILAPSIPITVLNTPNLSENIALQYVKGAGIRVNDISSDIGLGWELNCGGYISREVKGFADETSLFKNATPGVKGTEPSDTPNHQKGVNGWLDYADWNAETFKDIPGIGNYILSNQPISNKSLAQAIQEFSNDTHNSNYKNSIRKFIAQGLSNNPALPSSGVMPQGSAIADMGSMSGMGWDLVNVDGEPDIFHFSFGKYSGKFVFNGNRTPVTIPHIPGLKIESPFGETKTNEWIFTTPDGVKYYFDKNNTETIHTETSNDPYKNNWTGVQTPGDEGINVSEHASKWYLSKVVHPSGETITYNYETLPALIYTETAHIQEDFNKPTKMESPNQYISKPPTYFLFSKQKGFQSRLLSRDSKIIVNSKRIISISTSEGNKVYFNYNKVREDVDQKLNSGNTRKALSFIEMKDYNDHIIKRFAFNQDFFLSAENCSDDTCKRLKLNSVDQLSPTNELINRVSLGYYEDQKLPARNSPQQDYWGYYNNNTTSNLIPELRGHSGNVRDLDGADRSPSPERAKAFILKNIGYKTKGLIQYDYELNTYRDTSNMLNETKNTGGLRIKSIIKKTEGNPELVTNYVYELPDHKSSGEIPSHLLFRSNNGAGKLFDKQYIEIDENNGAGAIYVMRYSMPKYFYTNDLIRYSKVTISKTGLGSTEYNLTSFEDYPDASPLRLIWKGDNNDHGSFKAESKFFSAYGFENESTAHPLFQKTRPASIFSDRSYMRGLIKGIKIYDASGAIKKEVNNFYEINPQGYTAEKIYGIATSSDDLFIAENTRISSVSFDIYDHTADWFVKNKTTEKEYFNNSATIEKTQEFNYSPQSHNLSTTKEYISKNGAIAGTSLTTNIEYAQEKANQKLINANMTGIPLYTSTLKDGVVTTSIETVYDNSDNLLPSQVISYNLQNKDIKQSELKYDLYDNKGNILQYSSKAIKPTVIIWGYNQTQPIAKIEGVTYAELASKLGFANTNTGYLSLDIVTKSNADVDIPTEQALLSALDVFRNHAALPGLQITTYTYDPLIGVTSITPQSGVREIYKYDGANRLVTIIDANGNLLKEYQYHYKN
ncbi:RHS repeat protein [Elizabethkingia anophelis]|uniref:RHS repeat domain-containing protein n=1 Tax=Elizabethkingia anophelis TaxID=1117645 RepID=UPI000389FA69|nr:RHS repeat domain-containing protein [Elizabethkingia anophelis]EQB92711.1 hypothetical protein C874_18365 [Elizabethkingia anophelis 502]MCT4135672.1 RHS repeat protein [Elizabethkingia anophelis]